MSAEQSIMDIFLPVYESAVILAGHYTKACGRSTLTVTDLEYGWKFSARNVTGKQLGTLFPELFEESDSDEEDIEVVPDDDEPFTRYQGTDNDMALRMNECFDTWADWEPSSPAEESIKKSIDKTYA